MGHAFGTHNEKKFSRISYSTNTSSFSHPELISEFHFSFDRLNFEASRRPFRFVRNLTKICTNRLEMINKSRAFAIPDNLRLLTDNRIGRNNISSVLVRCFIVYLNLSFRFDPKKSPAQSTPTKRGSRRPEKNVPAAKPDTTSGLLNGTQSQEDKG